MTILLYYLESAVIEHCASTFGSASILLRVILGLSIKLLVELVTKEQVTS